MRTWIPRLAARPPRETDEARAAVTRALFKLVRSSRANHATPSQTRI